MNPYPKRLCIGCLPLQVRQVQRVFFVGTIEANQVLVTSDNHFILVLYNPPESNIGWIPNAPASRLSFNDPGDSGYPFGRIGGWQLKSAMTLFHDLSSKEATYLIIAWSLRSNITRWKTEEIRVVAAMTYLEVLTISLFPQGPKGCDEEKHSKVSEVINLDI